MINLYKLYKLTLKRKKSDDDYYKFQEYQASIVVEDIYKRLNCNQEMTVMDYGCGQGGYSSILSKYFRHVTAVDYFVNPINQSDDKITYVAADLLNYKGDIVDLIFCASVIEHINNSMQSKLIEQISENLKPGGALYLSFPPFYSPIGGHACAPFHYFPDKMALFMTRTIKKFPIKAYETMYGEWGLYKTKIKDVSNILINHGFKVNVLRSRYMPDWYSNLFGTSDLFNWNAEFYCRKL